MGYSVAIRTLGTTCTLKQGLESLHKQSVQPQKIVVYIAESYPLPGFRVGMEEYVYVPKGMVSQRALDYDEIDSEYILLLDDDVSFEPDTINRALSIIENEKADCIAFDIFQNYKMSFFSKVKSAIINWVFPRFNSKWAFKIHCHGSFSYINHPKESFYPSMSAAGPASLWRKDKLVSMRLKDELWLDKLGFAYGEDGLLYYKLYENGGKLLVLFDSGVHNLDAKSSSASYLVNPDRFRIKAKANVILWHRMIYSGQKDRIGRLHSRLLFNVRMNWMLTVHVLLSVLPKYGKCAIKFYKGLKEGKEYIKGKEYEKIPPYAFK